MTLPQVTREEHPLLDPAAFVTEFPCPLAELPSPEWLRCLLDQGAPTPLVAPDEALRTSIRRLLRHGGFKASGRSKPASEYLVRAAASSELGSINAAVDACNAVSLHSGIPISVVDLDLATSPFRTALAGPQVSYVFNASGQEMDLEGLLCLWDADGPCANAVKDSQRTKTHPGTRRTLSILWGCLEVPGRAAAAAAWYRSLLERLGARTAEVPLSAGNSPAS